MNAETVNILLERNVPVRVTWNGVWYYVDAPAIPRTAVTDTEKCPDIDSSTGWRFRGSSVDGESHLFDVKGWGSSGWSLASVQD